MSRIWRSRTPVDGLAKCVLAALLAGFALAGCSSNYYNSPDARDKMLWAEIGFEDQEMLCVMFWGDEGYKADPGLFRSALRDEDFGLGMDRDMAESITDMVASGVGCPMLPRE